LVAEMRINQFEGNHFFSQIGSFPPNFLGKQIHKIIIDFACTKFLKVMDLALGFEWLLCFGALWMGDLVVDWKSLQTLTD